MRTYARLSLAVLPLAAAAALTTGGCSRARSTAAAPTVNAVNSAFSDEKGAVSEKEMAGAPVASAATAFASPPPPMTAAKSAPAPAATTAPAARADLGLMDRASADDRAGLGSAAAAPPPMRVARGGGLGSLGALGHASGEASLAREAPMSAAAFAGAFGGAPIAAGEWDDNANYREFMRYLANEESLPIHRVDVSDRRFLVVRDVEGKPVPRCRVTVADESQHQTTLTTMASGRAILFPHGEGLTTRKLWATAACPAGATVASKAFAIDDQDGSVDLRLTSSRQIPASRPVDVAFILDTTGSMGEEIDAVRTTIGKVAHELGRQNFTVRLGLVEYKDRGDAFVTKVHQFSSSSDAFLADVARVTAGGGGDLPESVNEGLHVGLTQLAWGQDSVARFAFLIGDAPPHLDYANDADYAVEMKRAAHDGVQLFTVAASGMDALGQAVFRQVAEYTGATNLFVLRGGAGPQSTGAGDPKSSCGGTHTNYSSGNLDGLILSKITRELRGLDGDAMRIAGLYRDEDAKPCNERIAMAD
jgi:hypothetical protein